MRSIWFILEKMQGEIAKEIRVMLGEEALDQRLFTVEERERRVEAMQKCAAENTSEQARHLSWMKMHEDLGWVWGEQFDPAKKTHPNMLPWDQLPDSVKSKARIFAIVAQAGKEIEELLNVPENDE
jgi:hypothetical protein